MNATQMTRTGSFPDNRGWGVRFPYRDDEEFIGADGKSQFSTLVELERGMISDSLGWAPNRARFIYDEAYEWDKLVDQSNQVAREMDDWALSLAIATVPARSKYSPLHGALVREACRRKLGI